MMKKPYQLIQFKSNNQWLLLIQLRGSTAPVFTLALILFNN